jgi:hypothetical protein
MIVTVTKGGYYSVNKKYLKIIIIKKYGQPTSGLLDS